MRTEKTVFESVKRMWMYVRESLTSDKHKNTANRIRLPRLKITKLPGRRRRSDDALRLLVVLVQRLSIEPIRSLPISTATPLKRPERSPSSYVCGTPYSYADQLLSLDNGQRALRCVLQYLFCSRGIKNPVHGIQGATS